MGIISHLARHRAWIYHHSMPRESGRVKVNRQNLHEVVLPGLVPVPLGSRRHKGHKFEWCPLVDEFLRAVELRASYAVCDPESTQKHYTAPMSQNQLMRYVPEFAAYHRGCRSSLH